jgi:hypothetical protein
LASSGFLRLNIRRPATQGSAHEHDGLHEKSAAMASPSVPPKLFAGCCRSPEPPSVLSRRGSRIHMS